MSEKKSDLNWIFIVLIVMMGILLVLVWSLSGGYTSSMMGMMGYGTGSIFLIPIGFLVLVAVGAYFISVSSSTGRSENRQSKSALEILKERYARGEIERRQYSKMKEELES